MKKKPSNLLGELLGEKNASLSKVVNVQDETELIDVHDLVPNPENGYGIREVDKLMAQMKVSKEVTRLKVKPLEDGKYMIIEGHRRRAAVLKLLESGYVGVGPKIPCLVKKYKDTDDKSAKEQEALDLILSNEQREYLTVDEKLWKVEKLRPIVKKEYDRGIKAGTIEGAFRHYFAPFLGMSSSALQRLESLKNLSTLAKEKVDTGDMTVTAAAELVSLDQSIQDGFIQKSEENGTEITVKTVKDFKKVLNSSNKSEQEPVQEPAQEPVQEPEQEPVQEPAQEPVQEPEQEPVQEPEQEPVQEPEQEPVQEPEQEPERKSKEAHTWMIEKINKELNSANEWLEVEKADGTIEEQENWKARIKIMKDILTFLG